MDVVFIASLSHSGSTLLDLLLGAHPRLVGLGELYKVINLSAEQLEGEWNVRCTCDKRWHSRRDWVLSAMLFPHIMAYNSERVYGGKPQPGRK